MGQKQEMIKCTECEKMTMHIRTGTNNILHLILTIVTVGFWSVVWSIMLAIQKNPQCIECGNETVKIIGSRVLGKLYFGLLLFSLIGLGVLCNEIFGV